MRAEFFQSMQACFAYFLLMLICVFSVNSEAQITRPFTIRYSTNTSGDIKLIGNTVMSCGTLPLTGICANSAAGIPNAPAPNELLDNNDWPMVNIDVDSDPSTFNSSSATLSMPIGSTVKFAGLYWAATSTSGQRGQVLFKSPASFGYSGVSASVIDSAPGQASNYSAFADVTAAVTAAGSGVYTVANVQTIEAVNNWGGWLLVVVYQNNADTIKNLVVYDGYALTNSTNPVTVTPSGFLTPLSGPVITRVGAAGFDGDLSRTGDQLSVNGVFLSDALNSSANFFNSVLSENGVQLPGRNPSFVNNFGVDIDRVNVPTGVVPNGATSAVLQLTAPGENYHPNVITFATDLYVPIIAANVTKTVLDVNGGTLLAGDVMRWTIAMSNTGFDTGTNLIVKDPIPVGTTYAAGSLKIVTGANSSVISKTDVAGDDVAEFSNVPATCAPVANPCVIFRLGTGATSAVGGSLAFGEATSITFDTTVNAGLPPGTNITNSASISFSGQTLGATFTTASAAATGAVLSAPLITKSFSPNVVVVNAPSTLTIVVSNPATNALTLTGVTFTDTYTAGLINIATTPSPNVVCTAGSTPGTLTGGVASGNTIGMTPGATILPGGNCTITVQVTATSAGPKVNTTGAVTSANAGTGLTATATLFGGKISIAKAFSTSIIEVAGAASTITFTLTNATGVNPAAGVVFTDTYPGGLQNDSTPAVSTCGGTVTANNGTSVLSLAAGSIPFPGSCTITKTVVGVVPGGVFTNTTSGVTRTGDAVAGNPASAAYTVVVAPTVVKTFALNPVNVNDLSTLSIVVTNPNTTITVTRVGAVFLDTYPANLVNAPSAFVTLNCSSGATAAVTAGTGLAGGSTIGLSDMTLPPGGSCTVTSLVTPTSAGDKINPAFLATFDNAPDPTAAASTLFVTLLIEPTVTKTFVTSPILVGGTSVLRIVVTNVNTGAAITGVTFTDNYPSGLVNTSSPLASITALSGTCTGGVVTAPVNGSSLSLASLAISASGQCQIDVNVTAAAAGAYFNVTGPIVVVNTPQQVSTSATLNVLAPPTITKSFSPATMSAGGTATITIVIANPGINPVSLTNVSFSDIFPVAPGAMTLASPLTTTNTCTSGSTAGTLQNSAGGALAVGSVGIRLDPAAGATLLANGSCTITADVTAVAVGNYVNTTTAVTSANGGTGTTATATLSIAKLGITKSFLPTTVNNGAPSILTFTITNPTGAAQIGLAFSDNLLAAGLQMSNATVGGTCLGVTSNAASGQTNFVVTAGNIPSPAGCTITINVSSTLAGTHNNQSSGVSYTGDAVPGAPSNIAILTVLAAPTVQLTFTPAVIPLNGTSLLTILLTNPNASDMTAVAFAETYLIDLRNGLTPAAATTCTGTPVVTASANAVNPGTLSLSGATIPANSTCTVTVTVTSAVAGVYTNTFAAGALTTSAGSNLNPASATLRVLLPPTVSKSFSPTGVAVNANSLLTITLTNPNATAISGAAFSDTYPTDLRNAVLPNSATTCPAGAVLASANAVNPGTLVFSGGTIPANASCSVTVNVTSSISANYPNSTGIITTTNAGSSAAAASAILSVGVPGITKIFSPNPIILGSTSTLNFTLTNGTPSAMTGVGFTDTFPTSPGAMVVASPANFTNTCGGTFTPVALAASVTLSGGSIPANSSCTLSVRVSMTVAGTYNNISGIVSATGPLNGNTASATLNVNVALPVLTKAFATNPIGVGQTSVLTFTINNTAVGTINQSGLGFTDTLPGTGAITATAASPQCGGGVVTVIGGNEINVSGAALNAGTSCTITATVTGVTAGSFINGPTNNSVTGVSSSLTNSVTNQTLDVRQASLTKAFGAATFPDGLSTTLVFTLANGVGNPAQSGIGFTETLPGNLRFNAASQSVTYSLGCSGPGTVTASGAPNLNSFAIAGIAMTVATASCTVTVTGVTNLVGVTGTCPAVAQTNDFTKVTALARLTNAVAAGPCVTIVPLPVLTKAFAVASINDASSTSIVYTLTNGAGNPAQSLVGFTETLPASLRFNAASQAVSYSLGCSGPATITASGAPLNTFPIANLAMTLGTASCTVTVAGITNVTGVTGTCPLAAQTNDSAKITGLARLTNGVGAGPCLTIAAIPTLTKAFGAASIDDLGATTLVYTLANGTGNPVQSGIGFTETLPTSLRFNAASQTVTYSNGCAGPATITATGAPLNTFPIAGISMPAVASCTVTITGVTNALGVTGTCPAANQTNISTRVTALAQLINGIGAGPCLIITPLPILTKSFGANPRTIGVGQTATLTFTVTNTAAGTVNRTGLNFTDTLPGGGVNLTATAASPQCGGGVVTVTGGNVIAVSGAAVLAGASCTITAIVTGVVAGSYTNGPTNTSITGVSANLTNSVIDQVLNVTPPGLTKAFGAASIVDTNATTLVYTLTNVAGSPVQSGIGFTETLPASLKFNAASQTVTYLPVTCTGPATITATGAPDLNTFSIAGVGMNAGVASCTLTITGVTNVTGVTGTCPLAAQTNDFAKVTSPSRLTNNIPTLASGMAPCLTINPVPFPILTKAFTAANIGVGQTTTLTFTINNTAVGSVNRTLLNFTDTLPGAGGITATAATPQCGGGVVAVTGGNVISVTGAAVNALMSCTITATVTGVTAGTYINGPTNTSITLVSANLTNSVTDQTLNVLQAGITKLFGAASIVDGGATTLIYTLTKGTGNPLQSGIGFVETLPANLRFNTATPAVTYAGGCSGPSTVTATGVPNLNTFTIAGIGITAGVPATCTVTVAGVTNVVGTSGTCSSPTGPTPVAQINDSAKLTSPVRLTNNLGTPCLTINTSALPLLTKSFGANPQAIGVGRTATLTFTIDNTVIGAVNRTGIGFVDTLPGAGGLTATVTTPQCGGTISVTGGNVINVVGASLNAGLTCTVTATVTGVTAGSYINGPTNSSITAPLVLNNTVTDQTLNVIQPGMTKAFGAATIPDTGTTTIIYTFANGGVSPLQSGIGFTETLPASLRFSSAAPTVVYAGGCSGPSPLTATGAPLNTFTITGIGITAGTASCTATVTAVTNVIGVTGACPLAAQTNDSAKITLPVRLTNNVPTFVSGLAPCLGIVPLPLLTKAFGAAAIDSGVSTSIVYTLDNSAGSAPVQTLLGFTETLPASLRFNLASQPVTYVGTGGACTGPSPITTTGAPNLNTFTITGISMAVGTTSCTVTFNGAGAGSVTNIVGAFGTCPAAAQTNDSAKITALSRLTNNVGAGPCLIIQPFPILTKSFGANPQTIGVGQTATLTFTINNTAAATVNRIGLGFVDTLPGTGGITATTTTPQCGGGTVTVSGVNNNVITVSGAAVTAGTSCTITATITGVTAAASNTYTNNAASFTGVTANLTNSVVAQVLDVRQAGLTKAFGAATIDDGAITTIVYTLTNGTGNPTQTGIGFTETLPAGLQFSAASLPVSYSAGCGGPATVTATGAPLNTFPIAAITMPAVASCTVTIGSAGVSGVTNATGVIGTCPNATRTNDSLKITFPARLTNNVPTTASGLAPCLAIAPEPILTKSFGANPQNIGVGQTATLTFTINNSAVNTINRTGIGFTDTLQGSGGITATTTTPQCGGGAVTVSGANNNVITVSGAAVNAGTSCTITAAVTGVTPGSYVNGTADLSGVTANLNSSIVNQTLNVVQPSLTKAFGAGSFVDSFSTTLVYTLTNGTGSPLQTGIGFTETLPASLRFDAASQSVTYSGACTGPATITASGAPDLNTFSIAAISIPAATASCTVTVTGVTNLVGVTGTCPLAAQTNDFAKITLPVRLTNSVGAGPCVTISPVPFPTLAKSFGANPQTIGVGQTATLTFTIDNTAVGSVNRSALGFTDTLPGTGGITATTTTPQCNGGLVTVTGGNVIAVSGASVNAGTTCTITATITGVTAAASNTYTNNAASFTGVTANLSNVVTAQVLDVRQAVLTKAFGAANIVDGNATTLVFTLTNGTGTPFQSGLGFTETLPASLRFNAASQTVTYSNSCTGPATITATGTPGLENTFTIAGIGMPAATASCTVTISGVTNLTGVTGACPLAAQTNDVTKVTLPVRLTNSVLTPCLTILTVPLPILTKSYGSTPFTVGVGQAATLTFTITNTAVGAINRTALGFVDTLPGVGISAVATAPTCGETVAISGAGNNIVTVSGASVLAGATCTIAVTVTGSAPVVSTNANGSMSGVSPTLTNSVTNQVLNVRRAGLTKAFLPTTIDDDAAASLVFTLTNGGGNPLQSGIGFTETLPASLRFNSSTLNVTYGAGCSGPATVTATGAPNLNTFTIASIGMAAATATCTVTVAGVTNLVGVTGTCPLVGQTNDSTKITAIARLTNNVGAGPCLTILPAPTITKAFGVSAIDESASTTLVFTITNSAGNPLQSGMGFTETLPANLRFTAASQTVTYAGCTGPATVTATGTPFNTFVIAGMGMAAATASCTVTISGVTNVVGVTGTCPLAAHTNDATKLTALSRLVNGLGLGPCLTVVPIPALTKAFAASPIGVGQTTTLTFSINNSAANAILRSGLNFTDTLPGSGGITATASSPQCGGMVSVTGGNVIAVTGASIAAGLSCTIVATVTGVTAALTGTYTNTNASMSGVSATLNNSVSNQVLDVRQASLSKAFGASAIDDGLITTIVYTLGNGAGSPLQSGIGFVETLPAGLRFTAASQSVTYTAGCTGPATITASGSPFNTFTIAGIDMAAMTGSCTLTVSGITNAVGSTASCPSPAQTNDATKITGLVRLTNGVGAGPCLTVVPLSSVTKAFGSPSIIDGQSTTLVYTFTNGVGDPVQTGIGFTETLPAGLRFTAATLNVTYVGGCAGPATVPATGSPLNTFTIAGIGITAESSVCTVTISSVTNVVGVTGACPAAAQTNDASRVSGLVRLINNLGMGPCLGIAPLPNLTKAFALPNVAVNGTTTLTFTLTNTATGNVARTGLSFTDTLEAGVQIANPSAPISMNCGTPSFTAVNATQPFTASAIDVAAGATCTITLSVRGVTAGARLNTAADITAFSPLIANGVTTQTLNVYAPPVVTKSFTPATIGPAGTSSMVITVTNPAANVGDLTGVSIDDIYGGTLVNDAAGSLLCSGLGSATLTGGVNAGTAVGFTGGTIVPGGTCTITQSVTTSLTNMNTTTTANATGPVILSGAAASATLTVSATPPTISKAFSPAAITSGGVTTLIVTINNPNAGPIVVTSVTDTFPITPNTGVVRAVTPNASTTCAGGMVTSAAGSVTLTGGTVPANGSCTFQIDVTAATNGSYLNTIAANALTTNAGSNALAASATLMVTTVGDVSVTKTGPATVLWGTAISYSVVVSNAGPDAASGTVFSDAVPAAVTGVSAMCGSATMGAVCGAVTVAGNLVTSTITTLPAGASVTFTIQGTAPSGGTLANFATAITPMAVADPDDPTHTGAGNNTSNTVITNVIAPDLQLNKTASSSVFTIGGSGSFTLNPHNTLGTAPTIGMVTVTDTLPVGLSYVALGSGGVGWTCAAVLQVVTCTSATVIAAGGSGSAITINVTVLSNAMPASTNIAVVSGGNEPAVNSGNNSAAVMVAIAGAGMNNFLTEGAQTAMPGTTVLYTHTFIAGLAGSVSFATSEMVSPFTPGWTALIYRDTNCNGVLDGAEGTSQLTSSVMVVPGDQVCIVVKSSVPAAAPYNARDVITVTATFTPTIGPNLFYSHLDITTVGGALGAGLTLAKSVRNVTLGGLVGTNNSARPGDVLEYIITYSNVASTAVMTVIVTDNTPAYTTFTLAACGMVLPPALTACMVTSAPAMGAAGNIQWTLTGQLNPGQSGEVSFRVQVQ